MSEISMYEAQKKKMEGLCEEHDLTYRFQKDTYPPTFTISPIQGMDAQLSMLENVEEVGYRSPDASMTWIFEDGVLETKVTGGTFTISSLGPYGITSFSPIINQPELAILGVCDMVDTPVVRNGEIVIRTMMNLSLTADHRVIDGVMASKFLKRIAELLENPYMLLV